MYLKKGTYYDLNRPGMTSQKSIKFKALSSTDLEWLDKGPEKGPDALVLVEQLDQPRHTEQPKETDGRTAVRLNKK